MKKKLLASVLSLMLAAACFTACGDGESSDKKSSSKDSSAADTSVSAVESSPSDSIGLESETDDGPQDPGHDPDGGYWHDDSSSAEDSSETESKADEKPSGDYVLPKGADSEYELYKAVIGFLKNGYNFGDLKDVTDLSLSMVKTIKDRNEERNFILGMDWNESCALVSKLFQAAQDNHSAMPRKDNGQIDSEKLDYSPYKELFPESMQQRIIDNEKYFKDFVYRYIIPVTEEYYYDTSSFERDYAGTEWEVMPEDSLEIKEYHGDEADLSENFPKIYEMKNIGKGENGDQHYTLGYFYTSINGRYYILGFNEVR